MTEANGFDGYLAAQEHALQELRQRPEFALIEAIGALYDRSVHVLGPNPSPDLFQLLVACQQTLLSAAATISRGSPADALGVIRRGIEAACLAVAIKDDPENRDRWIDAERRLARWADRRTGVKPKQPSKNVIYPGSQLVESLRVKLGVMSDSGIHFMPEFLSMQRWRIERQPNPAYPRPAVVRFANAGTSRRGVDGALMFLASVHLDILDVFVGCFDGLFYRDAEWLRMRRGIVRQARLLVKPFRSEARKENDP